MTLDPGVTGAFFPSSHMSSGTNPLQGTNRSPRGWIEDLSPVPLLFHNQDTLLRIRPYQNLILSFDGNKHRLCHTLSPAYANPKYS